MPEKMPRTARRGKSARRRFGTPASAAFIAGAAPVSAPVRCGRNRSAGCGSAAQQAFGTQILVNVRPVNAIAAARRFPMLALLRGGRQESRIPSERHGYAASIHQVNGQTLVIDVDTANPDVRRNLSQRTHAKPPSRRNETAAPGEPPRPIRVVQNRHCALPRRAPAKLSRMPPPCPRGRGEARWVHGCKNKTGSR
jgi:hypothetical protein